MPPPDSSLYEHSLGLPVGYSLEEYRILEILGQGGFGITYLAEDTRMRIKVAIKELFPDEFATRGRGSMVVPRRESDIADFTWAKERFDEEAATLIRLTHPNIVRVFRLFERNNTAYIVMEYVEGQNFKDWIHDHPQAEEGTLRAVLFPLLDGLEFVHRQGFLHRDISPENIRFTEDGRPLLVDFGNARALKSLHKTVVIKHGFSPIEQYQTAAVQGPYTDIYALAGVMISAITREVPPLAPDRSSQHDPYRPLVQRFRGQYTEAFLKALDWGFAIKSKDRPQTVSDWRRRLTAKPTQPPPPPRPIPWLLILLSLALFGLLGTALWFFLPHNRRITVPGDYATIQAAINAAKPNDTVYVKSGTYNEALNFKDGITLEGEDPATTIVRYSAAPTALGDQDHFDSPLEVRNCQSGNILNLTFLQVGIDRRDVSVGNTWKIDAVTIWNSSVVLKNCRATSLASNGIGIYKNSVVSLIENQCRSNKGVGICFSAGSHGAARYNICEENDQDGIDVIAADPELESNRCISNKADGIYFGAGAHGKAIENICKGNGQYGIRVSLTTAELTRNECSLNQYSGIAYGFMATGKASENICRQNARDGIELSSASALLIKNELVKNSGYGISYDAKSSPTLTDNHYDGNEKGEVSVAPRPVRRLSVLPTPTISPTPSPLITPSPTPSPSPFHLVSPGPFDFLTATPTPPRLVVPDQYRTIQAAIDAAKPGDTVYVRHGTYNEALKFKDGITLEGEDPLTTIVRYSAAPTATTGQSHYASPLEITDCTSGTVANIYFWQDQADQRTGSNIWKTDAVSIFRSSVTIKNCRATSAAAAGILVYSGSNATLLGNHCGSSKTSGIAFVGSGVARGNLCEQNGADGIGAYYGASPLIDGNTLVKNRFWGIYYDAQSKPTVSNNKFDGNGLGNVYQASPSPTPSPTPSSKTDPFATPFGPLTLPSPFSFATPTPTPVTTPSPKPSPNDWLRKLFSPSPTPADGLLKK